MKVVVFVTHFNYSLLRNDANRGLAALDLLENHVTDFAQHSLEVHLLKHKALDRPIRDNVRHTRFVLHQGDLSEVVLVRKPANHTLGILLLNNRVPVVDNVEPSASLAFPNDVFLVLELLNSHRPCQSVEISVGQASQQRNAAQDPNPHLSTDHFLQRAQKLVEVASIEGETLARSDRNDIGVSRLVQHQRHLTKVVAGREVQQGNLLRVAPLLLCALHLSSVNDVELVSDITLPNYVLSVRNIHLM
mmetsp:Transcript_34547/g.91713  ORF Transcript_34547/g.91713 Transcript_34547/m.91713 type:complete len:247 (-) Transcript_34547:709-1449(-)